MGARLYRYIVLHPTLFFQRLEKSCSDYCARSNFGGSHKKHKKQKGWLCTFFARFVLFVAMASAH
jgi:hypothetical protein